MTEYDLARYARQIMLFGEDGQQRLKTARLLVAGAGGLGSPGQGPEQAEDRICTGEAETDQPLDRDRGVFRQNRSVERGIPGGRSRWHRGLHGQLRHPLHPEPNGDPTEDPLLPRGRIRPRGSCDHLRTRRDSVPALPVSGRTARAACFRTYRPRAGHSPSWGPHPEWPPRYRRWRSSSTSAVTGNR